MCRCHGPASTPSRSRSMATCRPASPSPPATRRRPDPPESPMALDRDRALALVKEYTASDALRKHMYAVELAMRAMAERAGEDADAWGLVGLVHDFDYERFP